MTHRRRVVGVLVITGLLLVAAVAFARSLPNVAPEGDMALMDLHQLNVARHLEPVGSYSRYKWRHPGPLYALVQLPVFWLSDYRHAATSVTALALNTVAVLATLVVLLRRGASPGLALAYVVLVAIFLARVPALLVNPWNPLAPILLVPLLVTLGATSATGSARYLPAVVLIGSFAVQAHVGFAAPVVAVCVGTTVACLLGARRGPDQVSRVTRAVCAASIVAAFGWALPLWDAISPAGSGNLQALWTFMRAAVPADPQAATAAFSRYLVVPFAPSLVIPGGEPVDAALARPVLALMQITGVAIAALVFHRRGRHFESWWSLLVLCGAGAAFLSIVRLPEEPLDHTVFWVGILGVMGWTVIAGCIADVAFERWGSPVALGIKQHGHWALLVAGLLLVGTGVHQARARFADSVSLNRPLSQPIRSELARTNTRALILTVADHRWEETAGLAAFFAKLDYDVRVPADWSWMFGPSMAIGTVQAPTFRIADVASRDVVPEGFEPLAVVSTRQIFVKRLE